MNCPECGAVNGDCKPRWDEFLILEFTDPAYGVVHHLTVAAYMIQHSSNLTREGWLHERELLREFLIEKKPPAFIRRQNRDLVDSGRRAFQIKSRDGKPVIDKTSWTKTVLDVHYENSEVYCEDITVWARSVLEDAETIRIYET